MGNNAMTLSIRIEKIFPKLVGKTNHALLKVYGGILKYNYVKYILFCRVYGAL